MSVLCIINRSYLIMKRLSRNTKSLSAAVIAPFLLLGSVVWAQGTMPPSSPKLGYGFEPGLIAGKDFVANQLIIGYLDKGKAARLATAAQTLGGSVVQGNRRQRNAAEFQFGERSPGGHQPVNGSSRRRVCGTERFHADTTAA